MEIVRYKPGEAVRWLDAGAKDMLVRAKQKGGSALAGGISRQVPKDIASVATAVFDAGKSALAELMHRQAEATEYVLDERGLEVVRLGSLKFLSYSSVRSISQKGDEYMIKSDTGTVRIKPHAYIVSGRIRVPIGWDRNGIEVAYGVLADELAARCKVNIEQS